MVHVQFQGKCASTSGWCLGQKRWMMAADGVQEQVLKLQARLSTTQEPKKVNDCLLQGSRVTPGLGRGTKLRTGP